MSQNPLGMESDTDVSLQMAWCSASSVKYICSYSVRRKDILQSPCIERSKTKKRTSLVKTKTEKQKCAIGIFEKQAKRP